MKTPSAISKPAFRNRDAQSSSVNSQFAGEESCAAAASDIGVILGIFSETLLLLSVCMTDKI